MSKIIFNSLAELVADIREGDARAAYSVGYRGKDFFCLAEGEAEAAGAVGIELGMTVGLVPLDMIVSAARRMAMGGAPNAGAPAGATPPETAKAGKAAPDISFDQDVFAKMQVPDLRDFADKRGIENKGMKKAEILEAIAGYFAAKDDPSQAKLPLEDKAE